MQQNLTTYSHLYIENWTLRVTIETNTKLISLIVSLTIRQHI